MTTLSDYQSELKTDQVAPLQAKNWKENMAGEKTFNLGGSKIILQKKTYEVLSNGNQNRIRIKPGLELIDGKYVICAYANAAVLEGDCSGSIFENPVPVFKLTPENQDYSGKLTEVEESVNLWKGWRNGEIGDGEDAPARKYIYPISYLLTKFELNEIFNVQGKETAQIEFGIVKTMAAMIYSDVKELRVLGDEDDQIFDFATICPPYC